MGWGWDSMMGNSSYARENKVIGNHFHDTMQLLFDGGDLCQPHKSHFTPLIRLDLLIQVQMHLLTLLGCPLPTLLRALVRGL